MTKREQQVLLMLKPKVKAFGFNQKEIKGIAAKIANNLTSEEDASDEDVNAEIENQIEAAIPFLQIAQSQSNRVIEEWRKSHIDAKIEEGEDDDEPLTPQKTKASKPSPKNEENEQMKQLVDMISKLTGEVASLKKEKTTDSRKSRLETLLKDAGTFGTRTLKSFSKMNFENDEEFEEFFEEVEDDLKAYQQERADAGLGSLSAPTVNAGKPDKDEPFSDDEIANMAENF